MWMLPVPPAKFLTNCAKKLTAPSKPNTTWAQSPAWKWELSNNETRRPFFYFLRRIVRPVDIAGRTEDLASISFSAAVERWPSTVRGIQRSYLLDCHLCQHAACADWLPDLRRAGNGSRTRSGQQQIFRRDHGRAAGELTKLAQHLLVAAGAALVRTQSECDSVCGDHGVAALGHVGHGRRAQADAEDLRYGRAQPWREWL